jgi:predicted NAD/FAD-binding protein
LCIAALNTPPEYASANIFLNVLRDSLGAHRAASDMLLPKQDLTALFPDAAIAYIESKGGKIELGTRIKQIERLTKGIKITGDDYASEFDAIVIATPPWITQDLMREHDDAIATHHFVYEPITTCYLQYAQSTRLDNAFYALLDEADDNAWGQFVFDRGYLNPGQAGLFAVVISAANEASKLDNAELSQAVANQLATAFQQSAYAQPEWASIITEKRATFACTPNLGRLPNKTKIDNIILAGDYTTSEYPATLESAVRSGVLASRLVM